MLPHWALLSMFFLSASFVHSSPKTQEPLFTVVFPFLQVQVFYQPLSPGSARTLLQELVLIIAELPCGFFVVSPEWTKTFSSVYIWLAQGRLAEIPVSSVSFFSCMKKQPGHGWRASLLPDASPGWFCCWLWLLRGGFNWCGPQFFWFKKVVSGWPLRPFVKEGREGMKKLTLGEGTPWMGKIQQQEEEIKNKTP